MDLQSAWSVAAKDFKIYRKKINVIRATIAFPFIVAVIFPLILNYSINKQSPALAAALAPPLMDSFSIWFLTAAVTIPTAIASYSLVGEKLQKSLEPLLATPMSDGDILLGKSISGLLIPVASIYAGSIIFMVLMDHFTQGVLGYLYYPNWHMGVILLVVPLASLLSVEINIIISARMTDARSAQQTGTLLILPFIGLYLASELGIYPLTDTNLLILAGVIALIDLAFFSISKAMFQREEILTRWK
jgi:ABC-2 type transport system permease protein